MEPLRLTWSHTWPDKGPDFVGRTPDGELATRIYHVVATWNNPEHWFWTANGFYRSRGMTATGSAPDKNTAARMAEAAWFEAVERIDRDLGPVNPQNRP